MPLIAGIVRWPYLNYPYRLIFSYVIASAGMELISELTSHLGNNYYLFHIDTILQGITLIPFFYFSMQSARARKNLKIALFLLILTEILEIIFVTGFYGYNSISRTYLGILMTVLSFRYLSSLSKNEVLVNVHHRPMFWFCMAILLYFFANLLIFFLGNQLSQASITQFLLAHRVHLLFLILSRLLLAVGFWHVPKTRHLWS